MSGLATALTFLAASFTQMAAGNWAGSFKKILWLQLAGNFFNHFLPFNLGSISLGANYYRKLGRKDAEALTIVAIPAVFGVLTSVVLLLILSPVTIAHVLNSFHKTSHDRLLFIICGFLVAISLAAIPGFRHKALRYTGEAKQAFNSVNSLKSYLTLALGSICISLSATVALFASVRSIHESISLADAFVFYLTSSVVGDFVPTPGGVGGTEAVLALELTSIGIALPNAVAATLIFRLITFWIPMIPGGYAAYRNSRLS